MQDAWKVPPGLLRAGKPSIRSNLLAVLCAFDSVAEALKILRRTVGELEEFREQVLDAVELDAELAGLEIDVRGQGGDLVAGPGGAGGFSRRRPGGICERFRARPPAADAGAAHSGTSRRLEWLRVARPAPGGRGGKFCRPDTLIGGRSSRHLGEASPRGGRRWFEELSRFLPKTKVQFQNSSGISP